MYENSETKEKAVLCGVHRGLLNHLEDTTDESLKELEMLAETAGAHVLGTVVQNREAPDKATFMGEGKLYEILQMCKNLDANLLIFDDELSGSQLKNIEAIMEDIRVIDRTTLILDIFAQRAISGEGKLQVELAQLKYNLPRLSGGYSSLSRLGGGIGTKGPGETKIETDRRYIRTRINTLENEIEKLSKHRDLIRAGRRKKEIPTVAIVGYTNAGKSTLLNYLTGAGVLAENMLFATLDPTARSLKMPDGREAMLIDTVGFIRKLPHHLIKAFKSTLEEAVVADVLLHIIDSAGEERDNQIEVVNSLLKELGCEGKPTISVFNKIDLCEGFIPRPSYPEKSVFISAVTGEGIDSLINMLDNTLPGKRRKMKICVPYTKGGILNEIIANDCLISNDYTENGIEIIFMADLKAQSDYKEYETE